MQAATGSSRPLVYNLSSTSRATPPSSSVSSSAEELNPSPAMFKHRNQGSRKSAGFIPTNVFGPKGTASAPLLSGAQTPAGVGYARMSDTSLNEQASRSASGGYSSSGSSPARYGPQASMSSPYAGAPAPRFGPTASMSPSPQSSTASRFATPVPHGTDEAGLMRPRTGAPLMSDYNDDELDDQLHTFTAADRKDLASPFDITSWRGWANGLTLLVLLCGFIILFAGYPIISAYTDDGTEVGASAAGYNLGGVNATGQIPELPGFPQLIDPDTPESAKTRKGSDGVKWNLVFSDEFNEDGRTFYPGDDPFFTAVDIHYWPTNDFEWYDPGQATTKDGNLVLTMVQEPTDNLMFRSGMIQSWNQLCFNRNAYYEVRVSLPGTPKIGGFWPGIWTMGNLGRPGYGGTTDGMWPYSYSSCDVGIMPNQTWANDTGPEAALTTGGDEWDGKLSFLPGQRLSACPCDQSTHPGPPGVGRGAVEIDIIEAQMDLEVHRGMVSQSAQVAPYDAYYQFFNETVNDIKIYDDDVTKQNTYLGGVYQQAVSGLSYTDTAIYAQEQGEFGIFGLENVANFDDRTKGHIEWINMGKPAWRMEAAAVRANPLTGVGQRLISEEPMALIFNFGMSNNFEAVDFAHLTIPNRMLIDYIRVYQIDGGDGSVGCDPEDRPTAAYIEKYREIYDNPNITTWVDGYGQEFPKNKMMGCT